MKKIFFIVTNTINGGEYIPSVINTMEEAKAWLKTCTVNNLVSWRKKDITDFYNKPMKQITEDMVIKWANTTVEDFEFSETRSFISYGDDSYNLMNIYYQELEV